MKTNTKLQKKVSKIVQEAFRKTLNEEEPPRPTSQVEISELIGVIMTDVQYSISDILQAIRVECGVAVIDILAASQIKGEWKFTEVSIKFEPVESVKEYVIMLARKIPKIEGVKKIRFVKLNKEV